jgi:hypothetical protein
MAVLFPIDWPEPFGLVMIEAMACGTPVIASRRGSVPEIIEHGVTGFIVENEAEAIDAIKRIPTLDRGQVRAAFERRFTARRMAESYRRCFQRLAAGGGREATASGSRSSGDSATREWLRGPGAGEIGGARTRREEKLSQKPYTSRSSGCTLIVFECRRLESSGGTGRCCIHGLSTVNATVRKPIANRHASAPPKLI